MGVSCEGTDVVMILLMGKGFSEITSWTGGKGILISVILCEVCAFSVTICCMGGDGIGTVTILCTGVALSDVICWIGGDGIVHSTIWFGLKADDCLKADSFSSSIFLFHSAIPVSSKRLKKLGGMGISIFSSISRYFGSLRSSEFCI